MAGPTASASGSCSTSSSPAAHHFKARRRATCSSRFSTREPPPLRQIGTRELPLQLEWIIEKAPREGSEPPLSERCSMFASIFMRLRTALESGRLTGTDGGHRSKARPRWTQPLERALTDDSPEVVAVGRVSWKDCRLRGSRRIRGSDRRLVHLRPGARPGANLPLQLPEGAVLTQVTRRNRGLGAPTAAQGTEALD